MPDRLVAHAAQGALVGHDPGADERRLPLSPDSPYCLTKRTACPATNTAHTASTSCWHLGEIRREVEQR
mgnify:CR=1 FL=1